MVPDPVRPVRRASGQHPVIPGYRLESIIGRGSTGVVYRARQLAVDREVALKVLHAELAGRKRVVRRLQREARTTARLAHPHIVSAIDMGQIEGIWWYAMELVDGPSLALRLRQEGRLSEREALRLFIPLCEALVHTWEHGVVHRDIKPGNILIDRAGGARLADLGLAFADDDPLLTTTDGTLGTPVYISPEQARDPAAADVRSDIWSFGATLFHALCGRPPFLGENTAEVLSGVLYAPIPDPHRLEPDLSRGIVLVLRKCLSRDASRRYRTPAELLADLERVRERRKPKVRAAMLEPVEGRLPGWVPWVVVPAAALLLGLSIWLLATQPWSSEESVATYAPLDQIEALREEGADVATLLQAIKDINPVPLEHELRWNALREELRARLEEQLARVKKQAELELGVLLVEGDYQRAQDVLGGELEAKLRETTGYTLAHLGVPFATWLERKKVEVADAIERAKRDAIRAAEAHLEAELLPRVERLVEERRWRDARKELVRDAEEVLTEGEVDVGGLPPAELGAVAAVVRERLAKRRAQVDDQWVVVDSSLHEWVMKAALELRERLFARSLVRRAPEELEELWAAELTRRDVLAEQFDIEDLRSEALAELGRQASDLATVEADLLEAEASKGFDVLDAFASILDEARCGALWRARDYEGALREWERIAAELELWLASAGESPWRERFGEYLAVRRDEAERLGALLERAAEGVRAADGEQRTIRIDPGSNIGRKGVVDAGPDPLASGFHLVAIGGPEGEEKHLFLRTLHPIDVEKLAGLDQQRSEADRLLRALFLYREGQQARAKEVLESGPLPNGARDRALREDLARRIAVVEERIARSSSQMEAEAERLLEVVTPDRVAKRDPTVERAIATLLDAYSSVAAVQRRAVELREIARQLQAGAPSGTQDDFERIFGADETRLLDQRVRLHYDFGGVVPPAWSRFQSSASNRGDDAWHLAVSSNAGDVTGLEPSRSAGELEDLIERRDQRALKLLLQKPIELLEGPVVATIALRTNVQPRLLVVSLGGHHFALFGAFLPGVQRSGYAYTDGREDLESFLKRLGEGKNIHEYDSGKRALLEKSTDYELRMTVDVSRGKLEVAFGKHGGELELLVDRTFVKSSELPSGGHSLAILPWEKIVVDAVTIEAPRPRS